MPTTTTINGEVGNPATGGGRGRGEKEAKEEGRDEEEGKMKRKRGKTRRRTMDGREKPREEGGNDTEVGVNDSWKRRTGGRRTRRQESSGAASFHSLF